MSKYIIAIITIFGFLCAGCSEILEPNPETILDMEEICKNPAYAEGFLLKAYRGLGNNYSFDSDYASDDAITNNDASNVKTMVTGGWTSDNNPLSKWGSYYEYISYINTFISEMERVEWSWESGYEDELFAQKLKGEAYGLRAWYYFQLFRLHAGMGESGELLGLPIVEKFIKTTDDYEIPRASIDNFIYFMLDDCQIAIDNLPVRWKDGVYPSTDLSSAEQISWDQVMGSRNINRLSGLTAQLVKSNILLYAASPSYSTGTFTMQMAAEAAADVMNNNGGLGVLSTNDLDFYKVDYISGNDNGEPELIWYSSRQDNQNGWESTHFPPSFFGEGQLNPTQNLVDAFPMIDGTPIDESAAFDESSPYSNRDPRLTSYILYDGAEFKDRSVYTFVGAGADEPGFDKYSTRTSYYMKKFLNESVSLDPASSAKGSRIRMIVRYTEALLNFAEAANAAVGPDVNIGGYTARDVVNAIRNRAGLMLTDYVDAQDANGLAEVIRNERRLEMCFEGHRFWDLRRWNDLEQLNQPAKGVTIADDQATFTTFDAEQRVFGDYQIYGPIPMSETQRYNIEQNKGW